MTETVAANPAAAPATETKKRGAAKKSPHPALENGGKLTAVPEDYNPKVHNVLKESDFEDVHADAYYTWKAEAAEKEAADWRAKANEWKALGGISDRKTAKKVIDAKREMKNLLAQLLNDDPETAQALIANDPQLADLTKDVTG